MKFQQLMKFKMFSCFQTLLKTYAVFIMLINVKIVGILTFMSMINFILSWDEQEKSFITSRQASR